MVSCPERSRWSSCSIAAQDPHHARGGTRAAVASTAACGGTRRAAHHGDRSRGRHERGLHLRAHLRGPRDPRPPHPVRPNDQGRPRAVAVGDTTGWERIFHRPDDGGVTAVDHYRPTSAQRRALIARDVTCRFPGCSVSAPRCDIDHSHDYARGGTTELSNLAALCPAHHQMKHQDAWRVRQVGSGVLEWTSPTGRVVTDAPISRVFFQDTPGADELEQKRLAAKRERAAQGDPRLHTKVVSAPNRNRTCDLWYRKPTLYPLSYGGLKSLSGRGRGAAHRPRGRSASSARCARADAAARSSA